MVARRADDRSVLVADRVVTPDRVLAPGTVVVDGDRIASVRRGRPGRPWHVDASADLLVPGLVDLHGDDVEDHLFPRADARAPMDTALVACDRANLAAGVTTKFHAVAFEDHPAENRSLDVAHELVDAVAGHASLLGDNRVHARCELGDGASVDAVQRAVERDVVRLASVMNHVPGERQFDDVADFQRRYDGGEAAARQVGENRALTPVVRRRRARRVVGAAAATDTVVASHDDGDPEVVDWLADAGVTVSEFPLSLAAARRATERGLVTAMGAPNLVRGGSLWDNLDVGDAVARGLVDVLCSDYRPYSLLESLFVDTGEPLPERVARVAANPAEAVGLTDRGRVEAGARADLLLVRRGPPPAVERAYVGGDAVYRAARGTGPRH